MNDKESNKSNNNRLDLKQILSLEQLNLKSLLQSNKEMEYNNHDQIRVNEPVWIHKNNKFLKGVTTGINKDLISCSNEQGEIIQAKRQNVYQRNPFQQHYDSKRYDLMDLDVINEPQIMENIRRRFEHQEIYSFVENTLLAINPYQYFGQLYTEERKQYYLQNIVMKQGPMREHQPHIYSITAKMLQDLLHTGKSQAIVISGESGAGKTQANKQCLRFINYYYQHLESNSQQMINKQQNSNSHQSQQKVQRAIEISNPILEAFGNSKTIRNNNSSRFGKYLSISLSAKDHKIQHAHFYNYLLEKSRIISRSKNQQNFHIFYEFVSKLPTQDKLKYHLIDENNKEMTFEHFNYLKNADNSKVEYQPHPDVTFEKVRDSLSFLENEQSYDFVCRILAAVLHLGNLEPYLDQLEEDHFCQILPTQLLSNICQLLQVNPKQFASALTSYHIKVGVQVMTKYFGTRQVQALIHSLAKCLYQKLFHWIIHELNILSSSSQSQDSNSLNAKQKTINLGFLDIYGFEVLQSNSLEQLFINYTNERLHQIYLHRIFKQQKQIFQHEGLGNQYRQVEFSDNLNIIELIDYNPLGIFNLLDEWCSVASPDQSSFITKLRYNHKKHENFPPSNFNLPSTLFKIKHTPKQIDYSVVGFREKNKDLLRNEIKNLMKTSKIKILHDLFTEEEQKLERNQRNSFSADPSRKQSQQPKKFLSSKYRNEMSELMNDLTKSDLHFIRCIKSNNQKKPMLVQEEVIFNQICYLGILDTIKIKKMGYCIKHSYETLDKRFKWLVRYNFEKQASSKEIVSSISNFVPRFKNDQILYGKQKVFFRDFAYMTLIKKYNSYHLDLKAKCHLLISLFIKNLYLKKKQRRARAIKKIEKYFKPIFVSKIHNEKIEMIKDVQSQIRLFLRNRRVQNRIQNIKVVQAYVKRTLETRKRLRTLQAVQKITKIMRKAVFRRKIEGNLVVKKVIEEFLHDSIILSGLNRIAIVQQYINTFKLQLKMSGELAVAELNAYHIVEEKNFNKIEKYIQGFNSFKFYRRYCHKIVKAQAVMKGWLVRRNYLMLRSATIKIQRGWREYIFKKRGSNNMFSETYKFYFEKVKNQNTGIQSYLYKLSQDQQEDTIEVEYKEYLAKFKDKFSIMYFMIDFESFVDLDICYPYNSWPLNYFRVVKDGFIKDNPIQTLEVGEMFTVAASTNKLYVWGMNPKFNTLDNHVQLKPKSQIQTFKIINENQIEITYQEEKQKQPSKTSSVYSTIKRKFNLDSGKVVQILYNAATKIIRFPSNQRISQISCGSSHVMFLSSSKKVYTMGNGKKGQLGHGSLGSQDIPRMVKFSDSLKTFFPVQVSASFNSSIILFSHKKVVWFGTNGTISSQLTPEILDLKQKCNWLNVPQQFVPVKIHSSWSRSMSVIGLSFVSFNGRMANNLSLRNKTVDVLIQKWQDAETDKINPPYIATISDHLQECHVKLPKLKVRIEPESKRKLKEMEEKVKNYKAIQQNLEEFSFCESNLPRVQSEVVRGKK